MNQRSRCATSALAPLGASSPDRACGTNRIRWPSSIARADRSTSSVLASASNPYRRSVCVRHSAFDPPKYPTCRRERVVGVCCCGRAPAAAVAGLREDFHRGEVHEVRDEELGVHLTDAAAIQRGGRGWGARRGRGALTAEWAHQVREERPGLANVGGALDRAHAARLERLRAQPTPAGESSDRRACRRRVPGARLEQQSERARVGAVIGVVQSDKLVGHLPAHGRRRRAHIPRAALGARGPAPC